MVCLRWKCWPKNVRQPPDRNSASVCKMGDLLVEAGCIALVYALAKFAEARLVKKQRANSRQIMKDSVVVCVSAIAGLWAIGQTGLASAIRASPTKAFTAKPDF